MISIEATNRSSKTKGDINNIRNSGMVPAIIYGGTEENKKITLSKKQIKNLLEKENFLSNIIKINLEGKELEVLPRDISYHPISDEPIHIDFLRIVKGAKIILEIPVKFINSDKSPGIKRGGVLNIVRRKVELKCPSENIPNELVVDLEGLDIGTSIKISSISLPENVNPTIKGRDFVIATVAAPTIIKEPEKPAEGDSAAEGAEATTEGEQTAESSESKDQTQEAAEGKADKKPEKKDEAKSKQASEKK